MRKIVSKSQSSGIKSMTNKKTYQKINNVRITIKDITEALQTIHQGYLDADFDSEEYLRSTYTGEVDTEDRGIEIRLQVVDGSYHVLSGDPQYDTDHRGFWGCAYLPAVKTTKQDLKDTAKELIDDAFENYCELVEICEPCSRKKIVCNC